MSIRDEISVNRLKLEEEAEEQAELFLKYIEPLADLYLERGEARNKLKEVESREFLRLKEEGDGMTVADLNAAVNTSKRVRRAKRKVLELETAFMKAENRKNAFDQRRSMIKYLAMLYHDQYWTTESIYAETDREFDKGRERHTYKRRQKI